MERIGRCSVRRRENHIKFRHKYSLGGVGISIADCNPFYFSLFESMAQHNEGELEFNQPESNIFETEIKVRGI